VLLNASPPHHTPFLANLKNRGAHASVWKHTHTHSITCACTALNLETLFYCCSTEPSTHKEEIPAAEAQPYAHPRQAPATGAVRAAALRLHATSLSMQGSSAGKQQQQQVEVTLQYLPHLLTAAHSSHPEVRGAAVHALQVGSGIRVQG